MKFTHFCCLMQNKKTKEGGSKRKYMQHLGRLVKCNQCGFDILKGSPLQPLLAQLILTMIHSVIPFEILHWDTFKKYYEEYISDSIKISSSLTYCHDGFQNLKKLNHYYSNANKIWNQMYFFLFCKLLGNHKNTRYQHMLSFTSEFYCHNAYVLKSTPRALYGTDAGEHYNDKIKALVHRISNRFLQTEANCNLPPSTLDQIIKYCLWEYYHVREHNQDINTSKIQQKLRIKQKKKDICTLQLPAQICQYFKEHEVNYKLDIQEFDKINHEYNKLYQDISNEDYQTSSDEGDNETHLIWQLQRNLEQIQRSINDERKMDQFFRQTNTQNQQLCM